MPRSTLDVGERRTTFLMAGYDRLEIVLPAKLKRKLALYAATIGCTMTDATVTALTDFLDRADDSTDDMTDDAISEG